MVAGWPVTAYSGWLACNSRPVIAYGGWFVQYYVLYTIVAAVTYLTFCKCLKITKYLFDKMTESNHLSSVCAVYCEYQMAVDV